MSGKAAVRIDKHKRLMTRIAKLAEGHVRMGRPANARHSLKRIKQETKKAYILEDERREWLAFMHKMETQLMMSMIEHGTAT